MKTNKDTKTAYMFTINETKREKQRRKINKNIFYCAHFYYIDLRTLKH